MIRKVFTSNFSFSDAEMKAKMSGYQVAGRAQNKYGQYVIFGRR